MNDEQIALYAACRVVAPLSVQLPSTTVNMGMPGVGEDCIVKGFLPNSKAPAFIVRVPRAQLRDPRTRQRALEHAAELLRRHYYGPRL